MALNAGALATLIETTWRANPASGLVGGVTLGSNPAVTAMCQALATAIVTHITTAGSVAGVITACPAGAGTAAGGTIV